MHFTHNEASIRTIDRTQGLPLSPVIGIHAIGAKFYCIYRFIFDYGNSYIGRTDRCLNSRIREHLPKWVQRAVETGPPAEITRRLPASSIARHVLTSGHKINPDNSFRIQSSHLNPHFLRLSEKVATGRLHPPFCEQKQLRVNFRLP